MQPFEEKATIGEILLSVVGLNNHPKGRKPQPAPRYLRPVPSYMRGVLRHVNG